MTDFFPEDLALRDHARPAETICEHGTTDPDNPHDPCMLCTMDGPRMVNAHCIRCDRPVQCLPGAEDTVLCFPCTTTPPDRYAESTAEYARRMMGLAAVHDDTE